MADYKGTKSGSTFEGSTNFGGPVPEQQQEIDPNWKVNPQDPYAKPPGIPESLWNDFLGQEFMQDYLRLAGNDTGKIAGLVDGLYKNHVLKAWNTLSPAQKKQYTDTDDSGNPYPPGTAQAAEWDRLKDVKSEREANTATFEEWENDFLPGVAEAMAGAQAGDSAALEKLESLLGGIKDPELAKYVGDYVSQGASAAPDQRDVDAQSRQLAKFESLSDPTITAEEKLMMEMSRRQTESDLRAQRGALANNLQARGVYGSGAELTQNMMSQQEAAQRQALEMLGAQSNAQKRAMEALGGAADLSTSMRDSSAGESQFRGTAADKASEWNKKLKQDYEQWKTKQEAEINKDKVARGETAFDASTGVTGRTVKDAIGFAGLGLNAAEGKTGNRTSGTGLVSDAAHQGAILDDAEATRQRLESKL